MALAIITGASTGIGRELALLLAAQKMDLVLVARSKEHLDTLAKECDAFKVKCHVLSLDLSLESSRKECFEKFPTADLLVNNAGFGDYGPFAEANWSRTESMIQLNITALTHLTHLYLPGMLKRNSGSIINVASTAAFQPGPLMSVYFATKAFVLHFTEAVASECEGTNVHLMALCPGPTHSGFQAAAKMTHSKLFKGRNIPSSKDVAEYTLEALKNKKRVAIHGPLNWIMAESIRFIPRSLATTIAKKISEKKSTL